MSTPPTLLLADDSVTIQRVVALTFADQAVRVVVAKDGQDAINRMAAEAPDLVLADTNMPCVDGYEVARWVRQQPHLHAVPVLLLAGATDPVDEQRLHDSGANGVLEKPFEPTHVISRVKELLGLKSGAPAAAPTRLVTTPEERPAARTAGSARRAGAALHPSDRPTALEEVPASPRHDADAGPEHRPESAHPSEPPSGHHADWQGEPVEGEPWGFGPAGETATDAGVDAAARRRAGRSSPRLVSAPSAAADVFQSLLAAEQGDGPAFDASSGTVIVHAAPEMTDEMLDRLAMRVAARLQPAALGDEMVRAIGGVLRDTVAGTVRDAVAAETRASVAEAVQAAVDGTVLGTVRGAVYEAVTSAVPGATAAAVEQSVGGRVDAAVRESADRVLSGSVEQAVRESLSLRVSTLVRETVEREIRETVVPAAQQTIRDHLLAAIGEAIAAAVAVAVPPAVREAVRGEADGQVRQVVQETAERLVREEIARIRGQRG